MRRRTSRLLRALTILATMALGLSLGEGAAPPVPTGRLTPKQLAVFEQLDARGKQALADGDFAKALGLSLDGSGMGLGTRSQRYAMLVDDGVVHVLNVEDAPGKAEISSAENLLKSL